MNRNLQVIDAYLNNEPLLDIGKKFGIAVGTIYYILKKAGISRKKAFRPKATKSKPTRHGPVVTRPLCPEVQDEASRLVDEIVAERAAALNSGIKEGRDACAADCQETFRPYTQKDFDRAENRVVDTCLNFIPGGVGRQELVISFGNIEIIVRQK